MPQTQNSHPRRHAGHTRALQICAALSLVALIGLLAAPLHAQRNAKRDAPGQSNTNAPAQGQGRSKRVFISRSSESGQGSRQTIKSDNPLNDYSAYRSGDRFYVVLPRADADALPKGGSGRGYSDMQVQRRGNDVVLSYKVQPGSKPRVEQKFNRLDVVFDTDGAAGAATPANSARPNATPSATPPGENRNPVNNTPTTTQNAQPSSGQPANPNERRPATNTERPNSAAPTPQPEFNPQPGTVSTQPQLPVALPPATPENPAVVTPSATPAVADGQLAQAQPPVSIAPITTTNTTDTTSTSTGVSLGALVLRNWPLALIALLVVGVGLLFVSRRSGAARRPLPETVVAPGGAATGTIKQPPTTQPSAKRSSAKASTTKTSTTKTPLPTASTTSAVSGGEATPNAELLPVAAASTLAASTLATVIDSEETPSKEEKKPATGKKKVAGGKPRVEEPSVVGEAAAIEPKPLEEVKPSVNETAIDESALEELTLGGVVAAAGVTSVAATPAAATSTEIAPTEVAADSERVQAEIRRLLDGEAYNKNVIGSADMLTRQLIAAELLAALSGRNAERRARAQKAFVEHGFFNETAHDLRFASAPAERSSAARSLVLVGDRAATSHLVAALEDPIVEVRRSAVESLATLRDPKAVPALEALLERERGQKNKVNRKLVQRALEACAVGEANALEPVASAEVMAVTSPVEAPLPVVASNAFEDSLVVEHSFVATTEPVAVVTPVIEPREALTKPEASEDAGSAGDATLITAHTVTEAAAVTADTPAASVEALPGVEDMPAPEVATESDAQSGDSAATQFEVAELPALFEESATAPEESAKAPTFAFTITETLDAATSAEETSAVEPASQESERGIELFPVERGVHDEPETQVLESLPVGDVIAEAEPPRTIDIYEPSAVEVLPSESQPVAFAGELAMPTHEAEATGEWVELDMDEARAASPQSSIEAGAAHIEAPHVDATAASLSSIAEAEVQAVEPVLSGLVSDKHIERPAAAGSTMDAATETTERSIEPFDELSTVPKAIQQRLASVEPSDRVTAITELSHVDSSEAFHQICAAFDDEAKEVRSAAARALYELKADRADSFTRALREADSERRRNVGAAIASSGLASEAISQLTGESREKTYEAFSLLFLMAKAGEVQPLIRAIEGHPDNEVRLAVVKLLALSGQKEILPAFRRLAVRGSLPTEVRSAVMEAIYQISSGQPAAQEQ